MKTAVSLFAVAGLAAAASGQGTITYSFTVSNDVSPGNPSTLVAMWADLDPSVGDNYTMQNGRQGVVQAFGLCFGFLRNAGNWETGTASVDSVNDKLDDLVPPGYNPIGGNEYELFLGQLPFTGLDTSDPIKLITFKWTTGDFTARTVEVTYQNEDSQALILVNGRDTFPESWKVAVKNGSFRVIPAPASLALLGLGGLVAARRRR